MQKLVEKEYSKNAGNNKSHIIDALSDKDYDVIKNKKQSKKSSLVITVRSESYEWRYPHG